MYGNDLVSQIEKMPEENKDIMENAVEVLNKYKEFIQEGIDMINSGDIGSGQTLIDKGKALLQHGAEMAEAELSTEENETSDYTQPGYTFKTAEGLSITSASLSNPFNKLSNSQKEKIDKKH